MLRPKAADKERYNFDQARMIRAEEGKASAHFCYHILNRGGSIMRRKVLVVDDEAMIRNFLRTCLIKWGYEVKEAGDGVEALEQLKNDQFDLLIFDILMPNMDGWQLLKKVRSDPETKDIPVIVLSARDEDSDMLKGYDLGANYYITKPFSSAQLLYGIQVMSEVVFESMGSIEIFRGYDDTEGKASENINY